MNDADKRAFMAWYLDFGFAVDSTMQEAVWQAACEWRDNQNTLWRNAAIRVGEDLHSVGPNGYYNMSAEEWLNWALSTICSKPNFIPPAAQINQRLVDAAQKVVNTRNRVLHKDIRKFDHEFMELEVALAAAKETK